MTDSRLPERYLNDRRINRLSAEHFRSYVMATLWSVSNRTDGVLTDQDLTLIPGFSMTAPAAFEAAELWAGRSGEWTIEDFAATQTSRHDLETLDNARRADRDKKRRQRAERKPDGPTFTPSPGDDPGDVSRGTAQDRTGQARQGQAEYLEPSGLDETETVNEQTGEVTDAAPRYAYVTENGKTRRVRAA
ncbi:hypothetical protein E3T24_07760 [Cryobacterium sp. TmT2-59]|uniref:hypothetical protein n=1 Tax=Cryobacterium sp. TmT2-59 TaxID=1259264 RepID=UPI00106D6532|nr:hypothetical protein [Cryobacterium sp. TmT2-59]TFC85802.1 hypothetical protein E3T24_07760 [Cryobacterium sp. TmT2-59]